MRILRRFLRLLGSFGFSLASVQRGGAVFGRGDRPNMHRRQAVHFLHHDLRIFPGSCGSWVPSVFRSASVRALLGLGFAGQRSVNHCILTFLLGVRATVGIRAPDAPKGSGRGADKGPDIPGPAGHPGEASAGRAAGRHSRLRVPSASGPDRGSRTGLMRHPDRFSRHPTHSGLAIRHQRSPDRRILQPARQQERQPTLAPEAGDERMFELCCVRIAAVGQIGRDAVKRSQPRHPA
jgi:hypothetical protein